MIFKISSRIFFHLFTYPLIYSSLFVSYIAHISCIGIHTCKSITFHLYYSWDGKRKKNNLRFWVILHLIWSICLILYYHSINLFNYFLYNCHLLAFPLGAGKVKPFFCLNIFIQENWIISHFKLVFFSYGNNLFDLHDKLTVGVLHDGKAGCKCFNWTAVHFLTC